MRRIAALLSFAALAQSVALRTGVLCEGLDAGAALPMAGMEMDGMPQHAAGPTPDSAAANPGAHHNDRRHDGAHCPLMADCVAAVVTVPPIVVNSASLPDGAVATAHETLPRSETAAPEPPPPKG